MWEPDQDAAGGGTYHWDVTDAKVPSTKNSEPAWLHLKLMNLMVALLNLLMMAAGRMLRLKARSGRGRKPNSNVYGPDWV